MALNTNGFLFQTTNWWDHFFFYKTMNISLNMYMHIEDKRSLLGIRISLIPFIWISLLFSKIIKYFKDMARHKRTFHKILSNLSKVLSLKLWLADRKLSPRAGGGGSWVRSFVVKICGFWCRRWHDIPHCSLWPWMPIVGLNYWSATSDDDSTLNMVILTGR